MVEWAAITSISAVNVVMVTGLRFGGVVFRR